MGVPSAHSVLMQKKEEETEEAGTLDGELDAGQEGEADSPLTSGSSLSEYLNVEKMTAGENVLYGGPVMKISTVPPQPLLNKTAPTAADMESLPDLSGVSHIPNLWGPPSLRDLPASASKPVSKKEAFGMKKYGTRWGIQEDEEGVEEEEEMEIEDDPNLDGEYEEGAEQVDKEEVASLVWEYRSLMPTRKFDSPDALMHLSDGELLDCFTEVVRALERKTPPEAVRNAKLTREDMLNLLLEDPDFLPKDFRENAESMRWLVEDASDSDVKDIFEEVFYKEVDLEDVDLEKLHFTQAEKMGLRPWKRDA
eukprot:Cvel_26298.t1-p1 / transcript=Cvel_26298.t1 / gene=Cvel_26298 / organism=Chromera_velia_CCMP2878 / gene_product=hypothetical protein / transcript_product=hypothetical protein / location=Cvel_scaffold3104:16442-19585(+) / protein_length=308 / sequence_SO=supercontig / SO=protein_coding / is_pseudo=false